MQAYTAVLVGESGTGKSSLVATVASGGHFPSAHHYLSVGTASAHTTTSAGAGVTAYVTVMDTASPHEYDRLRALAYVSASLVVLCIAADDRSTLEAATERWLPEVRQH
eukprot:CAMPEP_0198359712 /NCGR_PEP_ID=MMETSP1450-20131203/135632_1 /TAXON_ID=753684 ORGANISM="Madagascaria erythrocladiodes, Strain CCMP3234" /NCGR_SAMPLE_ID=MMETSP1450 /ASSEMBLY_ACC=CAM_ASM_001115 /LENGTH=108 /DNA_ID=CAMNT_0044066621 /DNA_START=56 /DNA_END=379 /DNA_ORIENTATION=+